jgi:uncharacterized SAM-binding protein YcdF (DUF218 family)
MHLPISKPKIIRLLLVVFLSGALFALWLNSEGAGGFRSEIRELILKELTKGNHLPPGKVVDAIYVLGGGEISLRYKYQTAAEFYKNEVADKILILSQNGITKFSPELGRNYTNDEWSIKQLKDLGVPEDKIEGVRLGEGFFGTLKEAKHVSELVRQRGYTSILLISQPFHTRRVEASFQKYLPLENFTFYIQNSTDTQTLSETLIEFIKLMVYQYLLL